MMKMNELPQNVTKETKIKLVTNPEKINSGDPEELETLDVKVHYSDLNDTLYIMPDKTENTTYDSLVAAMYMICSMVEDEYQTQTLTETDKEAIREEEEKRQKEQEEKRQKELNENIEKYCEESQIEMIEKIRFVKVKDGVNIKLNLANIITEISELEKDEDGKYIVPDNCIYIEQREPETPGTYNYIVVDSEQVLCNSEYDLESAKRMADKIGGAVVDVHTGQYAYNSEDNNVSTPEEKTTFIMDTFEDYLESEDITVPCDFKDEEAERSEYEFPARLFGKCYYYLEDRVKIVVMTTDDDEKAVDIAVNRIAKVFTHFMDEKCIMIPDEDMFERLKDEIKEILLNK